MHIRTSVASKKYKKGYFLQVVSSLKRVQLRLAGYLNDTTNEELTAMSLSPEGHAKAIIRQASDINNLCQMYPGWGAFL